MDKTRHRPGYLVLVGLYLWGAAGSLSAQGYDCGGGPGKVTGRVETSDGRGVAEVVIMIPGTRCLGRTDGDGRFAVTGLPLDSLTIQALRAVYCIVPQRVRVDSLAAPVTLRAVRERNPLDDAIMVIHGTPYVPPDYEQARCVDEVQRFASGAAANETGMSTPTPKEVLEWLLGTKDVRELMTRAHTPAAPLSVAFQYGTVRAPLPRGPVPYRLDRQGFQSGIYMVVLEADSRHLVVQVGEPLVGKGITERGFRLEWHRQAEGWAQGVVVDRWSPKGGT